MGEVASPVGSLRIVVIEDDEDLRETLVEALREQGHAVIGLPAQDGIFSLSDSPPADAWVVDHRLPGRLGGDVVRALREMGGERRGSRGTKQRSASSRPLARTCSCGSPSPRPTSPTPSCAPWSGGAPVFDSRESGDAGG